MGMKWEANSYSSTATSTLVVSGSLKKKTFFSFYSFHSVLLTMAACKMHTKFYMNYNI